MIVVSGILNGGILNTKENV